jgi:retinol dehydrogenase 12
MHPPKPHFTEKDLPNLKGKVYIVTGANTGVGKELARMLYSKNAKVYIFARSEEKANKAIEDIKNAVPTSTGALIFMHLDLSDLTKIKASAEHFLAAESKLHVLFNNAGVMDNNAALTKTAQGYEIHMGVNGLGTFLFTKFLTPILAATVKSAPPNTVRVIWVSSSGAEISGHKDVGVSLDNLDYHIEKPPIERYAISKAANWAHGAEYAKRYKADGIISIPLNPGNLNSDLYRDKGFLFSLFVKVITYPVVNGAYTELFAGLSPEVTIEKSGDWGKCEITGLVIVKMFG